MHAGACVDGVHELSIIADRYSLLLLVQCRSQGLSVLCRADRRDAVSGKALGWCDFCLLECQNGCCCTAELHNVPAAQPNASLYTQVRPAPCIASPQHYSLLYACVYADG